MERTLLYFPTIVIRNEQWIRQSILYWDSIGSIVPHQMEDKLHESYDIEILLREGLYRIYQPDQYVQNKEELANEFMTMVENIKLLERKTPRRLQEPMYGTQAHDMYESWVYEQKMYRNLVRDLAAAALIRREGKKLYMSTQLAMIYMALLAKYIANDDIGAVTIPSTDFVENINLIYPEPSITEKMTLANVDLHNVLPVPIENTQIVDILRFREKRKDELINFRKVMSGYQERFKQLSEAVEVRDLNASFIQELKAEVNNLGKALKGDGIRFVMGAIKNLFLVETPGLTAALATGQFPDVQFQFSIVGATVAGALSIGEYFIETRNRQLERLAESQYAYVYLAQKEGIVSIS